MLAPKLDFVRKCLSQLPKLASFNKEGLALVTAFDRL
jgi:hypothetical protein